MGVKLKWIGLGVASAAGLAAAFMGQDLVGLVQAESYIGDHNKAYVADGPWPHLTDVCTLCHVSVNGGYPSLAGQPAPYVTKELHDFASGKRANPNMRPLAMTLTDPEIKTIADYFARQPVTPNPYLQHVPALEARGEQLVKADNCGSCHGAGLMGQGQFPRLAGQGSDYLLEQLDAFAEGRRIEDSGTMKRLASAASPADRKAIAQYLASLTPVQK